ncbi:MAG: hypothetical protein GX931_02955 [Acholeplasmataceae bacterium]|jgi:hypothetical protein|nr:hypothetical protein [Acholeplasmataceae bacterium]
MKKEDKEKLTPEEKEALEELRKKLEQDPKIIKRRKLILMFSYGLHPNFFIHALLMLVVNILVLSTSLGILHLGVVKDLWLYFLGVVLFTFVEISIKIFLARLLGQRVIYSVGFVDLFLAFLFYVIFVSTEIIKFMHAWEIVIVAFFFLIIRFFVSYYLKKFVYRRRLKNEKRN